MRFNPKLAGTRYCAAALTNSTGGVIAIGYGKGTGLGPELVFSPGQQITVGSGLDDPEGVAVDGAGNVFIADTLNNQVLKGVPAVGGVYNQTAIVTALNTPKGLALDGAGNLYITHSANNRVLLETLSGGSYIQSIVGSGMASPEGLAVDGNGNVFIADSNNNRC
jgi:streptogramin lyase